MLYVVMHTYYDDENYVTGCEPIAASYSKESAEQFMAEAIAENRECSCYEIITVPLI